MIEKVCPICGKVFYVELKHKNQKFCSRDCFGKSRRLDIIDKKFGRLTVLKYVESESKDSMFLCKCDCGTEKVVRGTHLKNGKILSCGCLQKERTSKAHIKHNLSDSRIYKIYKGIIKRCYKSNDPAYKNYGGRGIKVCDEWLKDFMSFYNWAINNGYKEDLTIDRIDVDGNYEPSNCRWVNKKIQSRNTRRNHYITYNGETHCISEWAEITNLPQSAIKHRINRDKWSIERALTTPLRITKATNSKYLPD